MSINKKAPYIKYLVRELSFKQSKSENQDFENLTLDLGYSSPIIEVNNKKNIVIMPFKFTLKGETAFTLTCELQVGFELTEKRSEEEFRQLVNKEPEYFSKYIENAINKIISSTLANTAFNTDDVFDIPIFTYQD